MSLNDRTIPKNYLFLFTLILLFFSFSSTTNAQEIVNAIHLDPNSGGLQVGNQVPDLILPNHFNTYSDLSAMRGKYVYLHFWASWCPCSQPHIPNYKVLYEKYQQANFVDANGFEIYSVSIDEKDLNWRDAVEAYDIVWPHNVRIQDVAGENQVLMWNLLTVPTAYIIDPRGVIIAKNPSLIEMDAILSERSDQPGPRKLGRMLANNRTQTRPLPPTSNANNGWTSWTRKNTSPASINTKSYTTDYQKPAKFTTHQQMDYSAPNYAHSFHNSSNTYNNSNSSALTSNAPLIDAATFSDLKVNIGEFYMLTQDHVDAVKDLGKLEVKNMPSGGQSIIIKDLQNHAAAYETLMQLHKRGFTEAFLTY